MRISPLRTRFMSHWFSLGIKLTCAGPGNDWWLLGFKWDANPDFLRENSSVKLPANHDLQPSLQRQLHIASKRKPSSVSAWIQNIAFCFWTWLTSISDKLGRRTTWLQLYTIHTRYQVSIKRHRLYTPSVIQSSWKVPLNLSSCIIPAGALEEELSSDKAWGLQGVKGNHLLGKECPI